MTTEQKRKVEEVLRQLPGGYDPWCQAGDAWLDHARAISAINWFDANLKHVEGSARGQPFTLRAWQAAIIGNLFGWVRRDDQGRIVRRFRQTLIYVPRGNGKTPLASGIVLCGQFTDKEPGAQNYLAAGMREQAAILFRNAHGMILQNPKLEEAVDVYSGAAQRSIVPKDDPLSFCKVIPAEAAGQHGGIPHITVIDELHVQENRDLLEVFETAMSKMTRSQPLLVMITTADFDRPSVCNDVYAHACRVRDNGGDQAKPGYDPSFLPVIYEAGPDDDWTDEEVWKKANPNIGVSVSVESLRKSCQKAKETPSFENAFRRLHLNQRTSQDMRIISMAAWDKCGTNPITDDELLNIACPCYGGLDLASNDDLTSFAKLFKLPDGRVAVRLRIWCPESKIASRARQKFPYDVWQRQGWLTVTPGDVVDYETIHRDILEDRDRWNFSEIGYDSWGAEKPRQDLEREGLQTYKIPPTFMNLSAPTKDLLARINTQRFVHDGNPVLRWAASNAAAHYDGKISPGSKIEDHLDRIPIMLSKRKSTDKIDPIASVVLALARMLTSSDQGSDFDFRII